MTKLSKRAEKLLERVKAGHFYPTFGPKVPKTMRELVNAGLVGTCGRAVSFMSCYVPHGYQARQEIYPGHIDHTSDKFELLPADLRTHLGDFEKACEIARDHSEVSPPDIDDRTYWQHQIDTIRKIREAISVGPVSE